jgi:hypothetical protein
METLTCSHPSLPARFSLPTAPNKAETKYPYSALLHPHPTSLIFPTPPMPHQERLLNLFPVLVTPTRRRNPSGRLRQVCRARAPSLWLY